MNIVEFGLVQQAFCLAVQRVLQEHAGLAEEPELLREAVDIWYRGTYQEVTPEEVRRLQQIRGDHNLEPDELNKLLSLLEEAGEGSYQELLDSIMTISDAQPTAEDPAA